MGRTSCDPSDEKIENSGKSEDEKSESESESESSDDEELMIDWLYEESYKLIEAMNKQEYKIKVLKDKIENLTSEKKI